MIGVDTKTSGASVTLHGADKQIATLTAQAALVGTQFVAIEGDDGGVELLLTKGATTLRFHNLKSAHSAIASRHEQRQQAIRGDIASRGRRA